MAGIATNSKGLASLPGQKPLPDTTSTESSLFPTISSTPPSMSSPTISRQQRMKRPRVPKNTSPAVSLATMQEKISIMVKNAIQEVKESIVTEMISFIQPLIQKSTQDAIQESTQEITTLLLKARMDAMNVTNSIQELIEQRANGLDTTSSTKDKGNEKGKGEEKEKERGEQSIQKARKEQATDSALSLSLPQTSARSVAQSPSGLLQVPPRKVHIARQEPATPATQAKSTKAPLNTSWAVVARGKSKQTTTQPQQPQQGQTQQKVGKKIPTEERRILFTRNSNENRANTQDIILALNKALKGSGIIVQKGQYSKTGQLSLELAEYNSSSEFLAKKDYVIKVVRQLDPNVTGVQAGETWSRIKVYGVDLNRYFQHEGLAVAQEEIELQNGISLPMQPRWLVSTTRIQESNLTRSTLVVTLRDSQGVGKLLQTGLVFGGKTYKIAKYWEAGRGEICPKCCSFGHYKSCEEERCYLCGQQGHTADTHKCPILDCGSRKPCFHIPKKCVNCKGNHLATSNKCPKKWESMRQLQQPRDRILDRVEILNRPSVRSSPPTLDSNRIEIRIPSTPVATSSPLPSLEQQVSTPRDIEMTEATTPSNSMLDTQQVTHSTLEDTQELGNKKTPSTINVSTTT